MAGMRAERQQPLDARPVGHLLRPEGIILGAQLQQALALREQVRVRVAHRLRGMSALQHPRVAYNSLNESLAGCAGLLPNRLQVDCCACSQKHEVVALPMFSRRAP